MTLTTTLRGRRSARTHRSLTFAAIAGLILFVSLSSGHPAAQQATARDLSSNFDVRSATDAGSRQYMAQFGLSTTATAGMANALAAGVTRLLAERGDLDIVQTPELGTLEVVGARPGAGFLAGPGTDRIATLRDFLSQYADAFGLTTPQITALVPVADYLNPAGNMGWAELEQQINGIPLFRGLIRGGFTASGELARVTGQLVPIADGASPATPALTAAQAVSRAAGHVGWTVSEAALSQSHLDVQGRAIFDRGSFSDTPRAWLVYFPITAGAARLAWATEIAGDPDGFLILVDAQNGTVLFRKNLTNYSLPSMPASPARREPKRESSLPLGGVWTKATRPGGESWSYTFTTIDPQTGSASTTTRDSSSATPVGGQSKPAPDAATAGRRNDGASQSAAGATSRQRARDAATASVAQQDAGGSSRAATTDSGASQASQLRESNQSTRIDSVHQVGESHGWIVTAAARLLWTADSGRSWLDITPRTPGAPPGGVKGAFFLDTTRGWAITSDPVETGDGAVGLIVWATTDAGSTWSQANIELQSIRRGGSQVDRAFVHFATASTGWVLARLASGSNFSLGLLFTTTDGGRSWRRQADPPIADAIRFSTPSTGWLAGGPDGSRLFVTRDSGGTWAPVALAPPAGLESAATVADLPVFATPLDGSLAVMMRGSTDTYLVRYHTVNGGDTWGLAGSTVMSDPQRGDGQLRASIIDARNDRVVFVDNDTLFVSPDNVPLGAPRRLAALPDDARLAAVEFRDALHGWVLLDAGRCVGVKSECSQESILLSTDDGGQSFIDISPRGATSADPAADAVVISANVGFDKCAAGTTSEMQVWWANSPYFNANIYMGGASRSCSQPNLTASWVQQVTAMGWRLIPTWVGLQAPCSGFTNRISTNTSTAFSQGIAEADAATSAATALGLSPQTVIYDDIEHYDETNASCGAAVGAFVNGWVSRMHALGNIAGIYGAPANAQNDWAGIANPPDAVWIAKWDSRNTVWGLTPLSDGLWTNSQRLHQYVGGHSETWGGVSFTVDNDIAGGPVANASSGLDIAAQSAYLRTAASGGGSIVDPPALGQTVYFHTNWQILGSGSTVTVSLRAVLDGSTFCSFTNTGAPVSSWTSWCSAGWVATSGTHTLRWDLDYTNTITETNESNNSASKSITPSGVDLVAQRAYLRTAAGGNGNEVDPPAVGQTVYLHSDWQLNGSGGSVSVSIRAVLDGSTYCSANTTAAPVSSWFTWCTTGWVATAGTHTLRWDLDYTNTLSETNETNNSASKTVTPSSTVDIVAQRSYMRTAAGGTGSEVDPPAAGQTVFFHTDWQLAGSGGTVTVTLRAVLDGTTYCSFTNTAAPVTSWISWCGAGWLATAGTHTLRWDFDYGSTIPESNENNNSVSKTFSPSTTTGTQAATYLIYADDSPAPLSPTTALPGGGAQASFISRTSVTAIGNESPNTFNNLGWIPDGANTTDGNNVQAGPDRDAIDGVDAPATAPSFRVFSFTCDPQTTEPLTTACQNAETTDVFYWSNLYHDRLYLLGFTEAGRNFQHDNLNRGGVAGDRVSAEIQDSSGTNNANFSTPSDGGRGRMQMYLFPGPTPDRTSGFDHDVLLHELTHGTSNRLHSNASGLTSTMSRGMGEGWSDFYARALLSTSAENVNGIYPMGAWVTLQMVSGYTDNYYYGIRRFPYAVKSTVGSNGKPHNPLTFADIDPTQISTSDGAFARNSIVGNTASEVHNVGEVWCMALLEVRARFITRLGFATGNQRILQFVTDAMKLDPVDPTLLQGRDSLLAAANAGGATQADIADIWAGFAARGMGVLAAVNNASTFSVTEDFTTPTSQTLSINDVTVTEGNSGTTNAVFTVTLSPTSSQTVTVGYATANGTATAGSDYTAASGTLTFAPGASTRTITVSVNGDTTVESTETFVVNLSAPVNATIGDSQGQGTITNDDTSGPPAITLGSTTVLPGGTITGQVTNGPASITDWVGIFCPPSSADTSYSDWVYLSNSKLAPPTGLSNATVTFTAPTTNGATCDLRLFANDGFTKLASSATATVTPPSSLSINDVTVTEGNSGTTNAVFTVTLSPTSSQTVTVGYATANGTATAGSDYTAASGTLTFSAGTSTRTITVSVNGDTTVESTETFVVNLSGPVNATIGDSQGQGTITNDDVPTGPAVTLTSTTVSPGGTITGQVTNAPGSITDWVGIYCPPSSADTSYSDWKYLSNSKLAPPTGLSNATVTFTAPTTNGATCDLRLFANDGFTKLASSATTTVTPASALSINDVTVTEGNSGTTNAVFTVTLSPTSSQTVTVGYATANATATAGSDYTAASGTLTFSAGASTRTITVSVNGDTTVESTETFVVNLSGPVNATISDSQGQGTITNDDIPSGPAVTLTSTTVSPGGTIAGQVTNGPASITDWVGFYCPPSSADASYSDWKYLSNSKLAPPTGLSNATVTFTAPTTNGATCDLRLFANDGFTKLASSATATVATVSPSITVNTTSVVPGTVVTATLANGTGNATDVLALVATGASNSSFIRWSPLNAGVTSRTWTVPMPSNAGSYEFRLVSGNSTTLATSPTVTASGTACADSDGDGICNTYETNTGVYVGPTNTGTNPNVVDTDGDGIGDGDEVFGTTGGLDLPALGVGPLRKNILLEYDWFDDNSEPNSCSAHTHRPTQAMIDRVSAAFAASPVTNPDGTTGVTMIHDFGQGGAFTGGNAAVHAANITGGVNGSDFQSVKTSNFATNRRAYFHYVVMAHWYTSSIGSSGQAELPGNDLIVSLGCFATTTNVANTIMHELGHNLNLQHGGNESCNWKPNYNSVMNYRFQFPGVDTSCNAVGSSGESNVLNYSPGTRISLNENSLNENAGVCSATAIDWNFSGTLQSGISYDLNRTSENPNSSTGVDNTSCSATLSTLTDYNDWAHLSFLGLSDADGRPLTLRAIIDCNNPAMNREVPVDLRAPKQE